MALALALGVVTCILTLIAGYPFVYWLRRMGVGKQIRSDGPATHTEKVGTPTMGGLLFCVTAVIVTGITTVIEYQSSGRSILLPVGVLFACAVLGAIDDRLTLIGKKGEGITARFKMAWLIAIASVAALALWHPALLDWNTIFVPTVPELVPLPAYIFLPLAVLAIVGTANAVNLTDGLDSLAGWTAFVAFVAYGVIAHLQRQDFLVTFCFIVAGGIAGFLWFNAHPAEVFMGDTGSLSLGATLAIVALMTGHILLLPLIGFVFVAEAVSVIAQVGYFKLTGGRRLFRMAPLHHHFELIGWSETHVTQRFWLVSVLAAMVGVALALV
ncbi:MAG: phospho-N-acetylmuramoyl-pentapeptide-transferase [Chloroflexota bacterium]